MKTQTLREIFLSYAKNENLSGYSPDEFADRMMGVVDGFIIKELQEYAKNLQKVDTSGRVGNSVRVSRTGYLRGQALQSIRIGKELEEVLEALIDNKKIKNKK